MTTPRIEIAGYRDPDGEVELAVFVDGVVVTPDIVDIVDPGRGYTIQDWAEQIRDADAVPGASPAWAARIRQYYDQGEESKYVIAADYAAMDAEPGVPEAELNPAVWIGEGITEIDTPGAALVLNNTARAGLALRAVQASATLGAEVSGQLTRAAAAVAAYLDVDLDVRTVAGQHAPDYLADVVADLLADLMHLADARNIDIGGYAPQDPAATLYPQVTLLITALRAACTDEWEAALGQSWEDITRLATRRHQEQVHGTVTPATVRSA